LLLAASGREPEAEAEMAHLASDFPGYPLLARAERRFGILWHARRGDFAGAAALAADDACDAPIPGREDPPGGLATVPARPEAARPEEVAQIERKLKNDPEVRRWIEAAALAALSAFTARGKPAAAEADAEGEAEREALAEEEAIRTRVLDSSHQA